MLNPPKPYVIFSYHTAFQLKINKQKYFKQDKQLSLLQRSLKSLNELRSDAEITLLCRLYWG